MAEDGSQRSARSQRSNDVPVRAKRDSIGASSAASSIGVFGEQMDVGRPSAISTVAGGLGPEAKRLLGEREKELRRMRLPACDTTRAK